MKVSVRGVCVCEAHLCVWEVHLSVCVWVSVCSTVETLDLLVQQHLWLTGVCVCVCEASACAKRGFLPTEQWVDSTDGFLSLSLSRNTHLCENGNCQPESANSRTNTSSCLHVFTSAKNEDSLVCVCVCVSVGLKPQPDDTHTHTHWGHYQPLTQFKEELSLKLLLNTSTFMKLFTSTYNFSSDKVCLWAVQLIRN